MLLHLQQPADQDPIGIAAGIFMNMRKQLLLLTNQRGHSALFRQRDLAR